MMCELAQTGGAARSLAGRSSRLVTDLLLGRKPDISLEGMTLDRY